MSMDFYDIKDYFTKYKQRILFAGSEFKHLTYRGKNAMSMLWTYAMFMNGEAREYFSKAERSPVKITVSTDFKFEYNQRKPAVISLEPGDTSATRESKIAYRDTVNEYLNVIKNAKDQRSIFCVTGVTSEALAKNTYEAIAFKRFMEMLSSDSEKTLKNAAIIFFRYDEIADYEIDSDTSETVRDILDELKKNKRNQVVTTNQSIEELFENYEEFEDDYDTTEYENSIDFYTDGGKYVSIDKSDCASVTDTVLLNDNLFLAEIPKRQRARYFYRFLRESYQNPVWYGYEHNFYIHRAGDGHLKSEDGKNDGILGAVEYALNHYSDENKNKPICIYGGSGTGKTLTAGYIGYKFYMRYPVLYINKTRSNFSTHGDNKFVSELMKLLTAIEDKGNSPTLIILDTSSYEKIYIDRLINALRNSAKKFVLVCTLYHNPNNLEYAADEDEIASNSTAAHTEIEYTSFSLDNELNSQSELDELRRVLKNYARIDDEVIDDMVDLARGKKNFLAAMYWLFGEDIDIHGNLSEGVKREVYSALQYIRDHLNSNKSDDILVAVADQTKQELSERAIDFLNLCAMCTKFRKKLPRSIAAPMAGFDDIAGKPIPFFEEEINEDGDWLLCFRSDIQANLWLDANNISAEGEIDLVCKLIESVLNEQTDGGKELFFVNELLKAVSINSSNEKSRKKELEQYCDYYYKIIEALHKRNERNGSFSKETRMIHQEMVFAREFYRHNNDSTLREDRTINYRTINYFDDKFSDTNDEVLTGDIGQYIAVLLNNIEMGKDFLNSTGQTSTDIIGEVCCAYYYIARYQKSCRLSIDGGTADPGDKYPYIKRAFKSYDDNCNELLRLSRQMMKQKKDDAYATHHYYCALGLIYRGEEQKGEKGDERKAEMMKLIIEKSDEIIRSSMHSRNSNDASSALVENQFVFNIGNELLTMVYSDKTAERWFDRLIAIRQPYGIVFRVGKALHDKNIDLYSPDPFSDETVEQIQQIYDDYFKKYQDIAVKDLTCLYRIVYMQWIIINKRSIFATLKNAPDEAMRVKMSKEQWGTIYEFCNRYVQIRDLQHQPNETVEIRDLKMYYLYALCCYEQGLVFDRFNAKKRDKNGWTDKALEATRVCNRRKLWSSKGDRLYQDIHFICDENGNLPKFDAVINEENFDSSVSSGPYRRSGIKVTDVDLEIYYHRSNIYDINELEAGKTYKVQLAVGYRGLSVYRKKEG